MNVFPPRSIYDINRYAVAFPVLIDGVQHRCLITEEALQDHFGASNGANAGELVNAFEQHRGAIEAVVEQHIQMGVREEILLKSGHF